jgi:hypothetical protein
MSMQLLYMNPIKDPFDRIFEPVFFLLCKSQKTTKVLKIHGVLWVKIYFFSL